MKSTKTIPGLYHLKTGQSARVKAAMDCGSGGRRGRSQEDVRRR